MILGLKRMPGGLGKDDLIQVDDLAIEQQPWSQKRTLLPRFGKNHSKVGEPWTALIVLEEDIMADEDAGGATNEDNFYF